MKRNILRHFGIDAPLTPQLLDRIDAEVSIETLQKRLDRIRDLEQDLKLIGGSDADIERSIKKLHDANTSDVMTIKEIIEAQKLRENEDAMRREKETVLLNTYKQRLSDIVTEMETEANKLHSTKLADLAHHIKKGVK